MDKPLNHQFAKLIKEIKEFKAGFGFNPKCKCEKCKENKSKVGSQIIKQKEKK